MKNFLMKPFGFALTIFILTQLAWLILGLLVGQSFILNLAALFLVMLGSIYFLQRTLSHPFRYNAAWYLVVINAIFTLLMGGLAFLGLHSAPELAKIQVGEGQTIDVVAQLSNQYQSFAAQSLSYKFLMILLMLLLAILVLAIVYVIYYFLLSLANRIAAKLMPENVQQI